jgi:hypothetical protein
MTAHAVAAGAVAVHRFTLTANTEDVVTFADDADQVEILVLSGAEPVFVTIDGSAATVDGSHCYLVAAGQSLTLDVPRQATTGPSVSLISAASAVVSVMRA